jgi:hypothetical protein
MRLNSLLCDFNSREVKFAGIYRAFGTANPALYQVEEFHDNPTAFLSETAYRSAYINTILFEWN